MSRKVGKSRTFCPTFYSFWNFIPKYGVSAYFCQNIFINLLFFSAEYSHTHTFLVVKTAVSTDFNHEQCVFAQKIEISKIWFQQQHKKHFHYNLAKFTVFRTFISWLLFKNVSLSHRMTHFRKIGLILSQIF